MFSFFAKRKAKRLHAQYRDFIKRASQVATILLNMSIRCDPDFDDAVRYIWDEHHDVIPTTFMIWYKAAVRTSGEPTVTDALRRITEDIADAPMRQPSSRIVFCEMLYGMQDNDPDRSTRAWASVVNQSDGWPTAQEVVTLMSSVFGNIFAGTGDL